MFQESFKVIVSGVGQSFILGLIGYFLIKRNILGEEGLYALSRLVIEITLPVFIFYRLIKDFSFHLYPDWWIFPLISVGITIAGLLVGLIFSGFVKGLQHRLQFLSLVAFQNSGYLPLVLVASLLQGESLSTMFIYLFLFLLGFNLLLFSFGVYILTFHKDKKFEWQSLFSPPVIATFLGLGVVALNLSSFIPEVILKPLGITGDCTLPLATFVVGGNIAAIHLRKVDKKVISIMVMAKLVILPLLGLWLIWQFNLSPLLGLLIVLQLAMPPATNLSVILNHYKKEDLIVSQGIFFGHIASLITVPVFLSLYFMKFVIK